MSRELVVCRLEDLSEEHAVAVDAGELRLAVFLHEGRVYALGETCPHRGGPLHLGKVAHGIVRCPWHLWQFDLATGRSPVNPKSCVPAYPARIQNGTILVTLPTPS